tara:strand:- start:372 stop:611 length:240 start_codon:yes stop_codon:yes gene_type:complete
MNRLQNILNKTVRVFTSTVDVTVNGISGFISDVNQAYDKREKAEKAMATKVEQPTTETTTPTPTPTPQPVQAEFDFDNS